jgi:hypothetical protein
LSYYIIVVILCAEEASRIVRIASFIPHLHRELHHAASSVLLSLANDKPVRHLANRPREGEPVDVCVVIPSSRSQLHRRSSLLDPSNERLQYVVI